MDKRYEKVTFNLPTDLKQKIIDIKKEHNLSMSAIYVEAIKKYIEDLELKKWEDAVLKASKDKDYINLLNDNLNSGDVYEY